MACRWTVQWSWPKWNRLCMHVLLGLLFQLDAISWNIECPCKCALTGHDYVQFIWRRKIVVIIEPSRRQSGMYKNLLLCAWARKNVMYTKRDGSINQNCGVDADGQQMEQRSWLNLSTENLVFSQRSYGLVHSKCDKKSFPLPRSRSKHVWSQN